MCKPTSRCRRRPTLECAYQLILCWRRVPLVRQCCWKNVSVVHLRLAVVKLIEHAHRWRGVAVGCIPTGGISLVSFRTTGGVPLDPPACSIGWALTLKLAVLETPCLRTLGCLALHTPCLRADSILFEAKRAAGEGSGKLNMRASLA